MIDWKKIGLYVCAGVVGAAIYIVAGSRDYDVPLPTPRPAPPVAVVVPKCDCPAPPAANEHPWPKGYQEVVPAPEKPKVSMKPPRHKPRVAEKPRHTKAAPVAKRAPECAKVPAAAYQHPVDVVMFAAERRHIPAADLATLKKCITR